MQRLIDLEISSEEKVLKLRQQPITIVPTLPLGPDPSGLRGALALLPHMVSLLITGPSHTKHEISENTRLIRDIAWFARSNPLIKCIFMDMPTPGHISTQPLQTDIQNSILENPEFSNDLTTNGIMESAILHRTLWALPQFTFATEIVAAPKSQGGGFKPATPSTTPLPTWHGNEDLTTFLNETFGNFLIPTNNTLADSEVFVQPNFPAFFKVIFKPQPHTPRRMNDLRIVRLCGAVYNPYSPTANCNLTNPPSQNYILIGIIQLQTINRAVDTVPLYDDEGVSWDPNDLPGLERQTVSGVSGVPGEGEYVLYYGRLPSCYFSGGIGDENGEGDSGSCEIPLYSVENGKDQGEFGFGFEFDASLYDCVSDGDANAVGGDVRLCEGGVEGITDGMGDLKPF